jgi:hypothetical protein
MDEYSNFELNKGLNVTQKTKNTGAYLIAEALWTEVTLKAQSSFSKVARLMPYNRLGIKVRWNKHLTKRVKIDKDIQERFKNESKETQTREQFIKDVSEGLDLEFHGRKRKSIFGKGEVEGIDGMRSLAAQMYDNLMSGIEGKTDWRNIGDYDPKIIGKIAEWHGRKPRIGEEEVTGRVGMLKWKDGKSFAKITKKYGDEATLHQQITAHIQELSRDISVSQFLGGNHTVGLEKFMKIIDQTNLRNDIGVAQTRELDASLHYLKELVRPTIAEQAHGTTAFNVLRNLQAGAKLGSAVVTAILDIPVFITTGQRIFNLPLFGRDGLLATVFPGSGMVSGGKAARIKYARYFVEMTESWQNAAGARFILNDGMNNDTSWVRGSAAFAHMVFRGSGLNWWTKSLQSSAAGVYGRHLGELIQTKKTWNTLGEKFQNNLQKYGINETTWDNLVKNQHLFKDGLFDANGRLDMYKLGEGDIVVKNKVAKLVLGNDKGVSSTRSKFIAAVADAVDTMVMKPSQFDRMAGAFFIPEYQGTGAQIVRSMTQFKAHPISFFRKTVARNWQHQSSTDMLMSTAVIAASLIATSAVTIQLKEFIKGRPTYDASKMEFWQRVATESGTLGIVSDLMFSMFGGDKMIAGFQKDNNVRAMTKMDIINNVIGPLAADVLEVMDSGINLALAKDKKARAREFEDLAILATNQVPFKSIWWSKMLWRKYVTEYFSEMINPKGYRRAQKRIQKRLRKNRGTGIMFGKPIRSADGALMNFWKGGFN